MDRLKFNPFFQIVFLGLLASLNGYTFIYRPYKNKQDILKAPYGIAANPLRAKLQLPLIENDMTACYPYNNSGSNRWEAAHQNPGKGQIIHIYKTVDADNQTFKIEQETDAFRRKINDSVFQQLTITTIFKADTVLKKEGWLFYWHNTGYYGYNNEEKDLDSHGVDSVASSWRLRYFMKGR